MDKQSQLTNKVFEDPNSNISEPPHGQQKSFDLKLIVVLAITIATWLGYTPLAIFLGFLPPFSQLNVIPGYSLNLTLPLSVIIAVLFLVVFLKIFLKQKKYIFIGTVLFIILIICTGIINKIKQNTLINKYTAEVETKTTIAKKTEIKITDFQIFPSYDSNGAVSKMAFKVKFISNMSADIGIFPQINLWANHIQTGKPFRFNLKTDNAKYGDIMRHKSGSSNVNKGENIIEFEVSDYISELIRKYIIGNQGKFEVRFIFNIQTSDPNGYGQGNATTVENIIDKTGKATNDTSENNLGMVYLTPNYKIIN